MPEFSVELHAQGAFDGGPDVGRLGGFYVVRVVRADSVANAGRLAISLLQAEEKYEAIIARRHGVGLEIGVEGVHELSGDLDKPVRDSGYVFYPEETVGGAA